jgi:GT2 family glycosyltransferase
LKPFAFIVITYNRPEDMLALARNIAGFGSAAELLEEVVILNNASTADYSGVKSFIKENPQIPFRYVDSDENLGVARGRNRAISLSTAPILIMLDDDAEMQDANCLLQLQEAFKPDASRRPVAIVSFKVLYFDTLEMQVNAFPHKDFEGRRQRVSFDTYYYAGGAHAITRASLEKVGRYPEDFFYGMEEYDLAYRMLDAGYRIVYASKPVMLHKESPLGRQPKEEKIRSMWINKSKVAWRYLPTKFFYSTAWMWSLEYLRKTGYNWKGYTKAWKEIQQIRKLGRRQTVSKETLEYLKSVDARLWY